MSGCCGDGDRDGQHRFKHSQARVQTCHHQQRRCRGYLPHCPHHVTSLPVRRQVAGKTPHQRYRNKSEEKITSWQPNVFTNIQIFRGAYSKQPAAALWGCTDHHTPQRQEKVPQAEQRARMLKSVYFSWNADRLNPDHLLFLFKSVLRLDLLEVWHREQEALFIFCFCSDNFALLHLSPCSTRVVLFKSAQHETTCCVKTREINEVFLFDTMGKS